MSQPVQSTLVGLTVAVVWDIDGDRKQWYLARVTDTDDMGNYVCDHYERVKAEENSLWRRPTRDDIQDVSDVQILKVEIISEWIFTRRLTHLKLLNSEDVSKMFTEV